MAIDTTSYLLGKKAGGGGGGANIQTSKSVGYTSNGDYTVQPDEGYDAIATTNINVNVQPNLQNKSETISNNTTTTIEKDTGYDGLGTVSITTNVQPNLQNKNVTISSNTLTTIQKDEGYDGLGTVSVTTNVPATSIPDWTEIGYAGVPETVTEGFNYAKQMLQNWDATTSAYQRYNGNKNVVFVPKITHNNYRMERCFYSCTSLIYVDEIILNSDSTTQVANITSIFYNNTALKNVKGITITSPKGIRMDSAFQYCSNLKTVGFINCNPASENFNSLFSNCSALTDLPEIDGSNTLNIYGMFDSCSSLTNFGGIKDLGKAYLTTQSANYNGYWLNISSCGSLTHDSLMNIINKLYDIGAKGCNPQKITLGSTNYAKLTAQEIAIGTNKGWNIVAS